MKIVQKKICLLGDFSVGKTSLIRRFVEERFSETYLSTIGVHMSRKRLQRTDYVLDFFIWDLVGGENFDKMGRSYLLGAAGAIVVCDLTRPDTLSGFSNYTDQLRRVSSDAAIVFVGNKVDLTDDRLISDQDLQTAVLPYTNNNYLLTSAKTGQNVNAAFNMLADCLNE